MHVCRRRRPTAWRRSAARLVAALVLTGSVLPVGTGVSVLAQEYEDVKAQRETLEAQVNATLVEHDDLLARLYGVENELMQLESDTITLQQQAVEAEAALARQARAAYVRGDGTFRTVHAIRSVVSRSEGAGGNAYVPRDRYSLRMSFCVVPCSSATSAPCSSATAT